MTHLTIQQLSASLDGALAGPSHELVVRHLAVCHDCRDRQARLAKHDDALRRLLAQEPSESFLDELSRRTEAQVRAVAEGLPAAPFVTSVPLLHEEDPNAPAEPPPPPPRPELGSAAELAKQAGWGRIGLKPTASTQAPESDPEEAQRMLEALERGDSGEFTELTAQGPRDNAAVDGPVFDLPAWLKEHSRRGEAKPSASREVPKLYLFLESLDEHAANLSHEAVEEAFRHDDPAPEPEPELTPGTGAPPETPPVSGVGDPMSVPAAQVARALRDLDLALLRPEPGPELDEFEAGEAGYALAGAESSASSGQESSISSDRESSVSNERESSISNKRESRTSDASGSARPGSTPITIAAVPPRARRQREYDRALVMALASVGGLLLVVLAMQLAPPAPVRAPGENSVTVFGVRLPRVQVLRHGEPASAPPLGDPRVHAASTPAPTDVAQPASAPPAVVPPAADTVARVQAEPTGRDSARSPQPSAQRTPPHNSTRRSPSTNPSPVPPAASPAVAPTAVPLATPPAAAPAPATDDADWPLVCGQVQDATGQPVAGARVSLARISFAMRTDARGRFCLSAPAGAQSLLVEAPGFAPRTLPVTFAAAAPELRIRLDATH